MNQWRLWTYNLKLKRPITASGEDGLRRKGMIIGIKGNDGIWGYGEAATIEDLHHISHRHRKRSLGLFKRSPRLQRIRLLMRLIVAP